MPALPKELPEVTADILERLRARRVRVHCITNSVAQNFTANVLLAVGDVPSMTLSADEIGAFVASAGAVGRDARDMLTVVGLTGESDRVTDGARLAHIRNGDALMARVTAMGCAASSLVAAFLAREGDPWTATAAALLAFAVAGEVAA